MPTGARGKRDAGVGGGGASRSEQDIRGKEEGERKYLEYIKKGREFLKSGHQKAQSKKKSSAAVVTMIGIFMFHEGLLTPPVVSKM